MAGHAGTASSRPYRLQSALPLRVYHEVSQAGAGGEIGHSVRDLIREICRSEDIEILQGHVRPDHVHLRLSAPPHLAPSRVMQAIKGKTSHHLLQDYRRCGRRSGAGTCGGAAISSRAVAMSPTRRLPNIFGCKVPSPRRTTASKLAMSRPASAGGAPLQSTSVDTESLAFRRGLISIPGAAPANPAAPGRGPGYRSAA